MSCGAVRWKPWMAPSLLLDQAHNKMCRHEALAEGLWVVHEKWVDTYNRAVAATHNASTEETATV